LNNVTLKVILGVTQRNDEGS